MNSNNGAILHIAMCFAVFAAMFGIHGGAWIIGSAICIFVAGMLCNVYHAKVYNAYNELRYSASRKV